MNDSLNCTVPSNYDDVWLIGIRIDPDKETSDFFTIFFSGDTDVPLTIDSYIVFCNQVDYLIEMINKKIINKSKTIDISDLFVVDIAEMLYLINLEKIDESNTIINSLNIIIDLVKASRLKMPDEYKEILFKFADYFTFNQDVSSFFTEIDVEKNKVINILLWCIGAIVSKSKFLTDTSSSL